MKKYSSNSISRLKALLAVMVLMYSGNVLLADGGGDHDDDDDSPAPSSTIVETLHNMSAGGPGRVRALSETEICIFCHTPHRSSKDAPLWNRYSSGAVYIPYSSSTAKGRFGQPTGSSRLCLSCHDGTVALGLVRSRRAQIEFHGRIVRMPSGRSNLGTDLSDDHPISFVYDSALARANGELADPASLTGPVRLDGNGEMQCTTCHNPHNNEYGKFLAMNNAGSALCSTCHQKNYWNTSSHRTSTATWKGTGPDPWPHTPYGTVAENACENCHRPHTAGTHERLLNFAGEEDNCYRCHNGNVAEFNIEAEFGKAHVHDIEAQAGEHDPVEDILMSNNRHVECFDCHNAHAANQADASAPDASGALAGLKGIDASGDPIQEITKEYELCFRCHSDGAGKGDPAIPRIDPETNTRLEFDAGNPSYHPVVAKGKNSNVPSLKDDYNETSMIYCTDCHNNDRGPGAGGQGPNGPHGSRWPMLLERQLEFTDGSRENANIYALCYKCHDRDNLMSDESFPHELHVRDEDTSCQTCHDPHGSRDHSHLINFNQEYVKPSGNGLLLWEDTGTHQGKCYLTCHGEDHSPYSYPNNELEILLP